ncbi:manganese efflux pump MntP family protein [Alkalibacter saccharofermentans]|uniref:Putative manganese efflux pump MntP n=1 Tax=Alkalibacter saccharofermentans DSM 14828 TaxID=1120975 RepID=A0A1M4TBU6_9FIRM|nr:manganese efflux pump MntP family protein [Alkalibacter saccharofermentans]SHE41844.1 Putative Mn2+ efflux pump MntP [Alkalibacter saccharofermentans DSM 14828]
MSTFVMMSTAVALSMDAFAVAASCGISNKAKTLGLQGKIALFFGLFQGIMPLMGYFLAATFADRIRTVDHWIAFGLLVFIGIRMILESREEDRCGTGKLSNRYLFTLAIATSIDAMASGIGFAFLDVNIWLIAGVIALTTFVISFVGARFGHSLGHKFQAGSEIFGGSVLILIGGKILLEGLAII